MFSVINFEILDNAFIDGLGLACGVRWQEEEALTFNPVSLGWAEQLSTTMTTFLFWFLKHRSSLLSQAVKSSEVIQALLCAS